MTNKNWKNKRVLITGHTGFKGSWLCILLNRLGAKISGISLAEPVSDPNLFSILKIKKFVNDFRGNINSIEDCKRVIQKTNPEIDLCSSGQLI